MARSPRDWRWSSYRPTAGQQEVPAFLTVGWILAQFDRDSSRAEVMYRKYVRQGRGVAIWDELRRGNLLGTDTFIERIGPLLNEQLTAIEVPRDQRLAARPTLETLFDDAHDKPSRNEQIHQAVRVHEYALKEVADFLGLYYSTVSVIAKRVAEERKHQE